MGEDLKIRLAAFDWLKEQTTASDDILSRELLQVGFFFDGKRIPLISPQGIFKPREMKYPLTITTSPESPYNDSFDPSGYLLYRYRGKDPQHRDNIGLREAMIRRLPLIYLHGITPGKYMAIWPVFIIGDDPGNLSFQVAVDDLTQIYFAKDDLSLVADADNGRRAYITSTVKVRMHQRSFRERVLDAYQSQCALCQLRHRELLDAAHIFPDDHPQGEPIVSNGISLCKLHHAAFDNFFIGISPDFIVNVRRSILDEEDGPMLLHGLKELHNRRILLPYRKGYWPNKDALEWKYKRFLKVS
jgi:putative restriction endonuclease